MLTALFSSQGLKTYISNALESGSALMNRRRVKHVIQARLPLLDLSGILPPFASALRLISRQLISAFKTHNLFYPYAIGSHRRSQKVTWWFFVCWFGFGLRIMPLWPNKQGINSNSPCFPFFTSYHHSPPFLTLLLFSYQARYVPSLCLYYLLFYSSLDHGSVLGS